MLRDIRVAFRSFVREPGFAAVLVLTIAVGIGATTAIVSVVHAVMWKPLPYRDPSSLVRVLNRQSAVTRNCPTVPITKDARYCFWPRMEMPR